MSWKPFRLHRWLCLSTPDSSPAFPEVSLQGLLPVDTSLCPLRRAAPWAPGSQLHLVLYWRDIRAVPLAVLSHPESPLPQRGSLSRLHAPCFPPTP